MSCVLIQGTCRHGTYTLLCPEWVNLHEGVYITRLLLVEDVWLSLFLPLFLFFLPSAQLFFFGELSPTLRKHDCDGATGVGEDPDEVRGELMRAGDTPQSGFARSSPWILLEVLSNGSLLSAGVASLNECELEAAGGYYWLPIVVSQMTTNLVI